VTELRITLTTWDHGRRTDKTVADGVPRDYLLEWPNRALVIREMTQVVFRSTTPPITVDRKNDTDALTNLQ
jgi:hypothetical protein